MYCVFQLLAGDIRTVHLEFCWTHRGGGGGKSHDNVPTKSELYRVILTL